MTESTLQCPRDDHPLRPVKYEDNIEVDECSHCHGMWLDKGELEEIQRHPHHDYTKQLDELPDDVAQSIELVSQRRQGPIQCPKCGAEMETREYAYCSQIMIDTCVDGCGVWLDRGEIEALELFFERSQKEADAAIPLRWRLWASLYGLFHKSGR